MGFYVNLFEGCLVGLVCYGILLLFSFEGFFFGKMGFWEVVVVGDVDMF